MFRKSVPFELDEYNSLTRCLLRKESVCKTLLRDYSYPFIGKNNQKSYEVLLDVMYDEGFM